MEKLIGVCNLYRSLKDGRKWLFVGQLDDRFLPYLVDFLLHVRAKVQVSLNFFLATWIKKLATDLSRGPCSAKAICVFRRNYFPFIVVLIKRGTHLLISNRNEN